MVRWTAESAVSYKAAAEKTDTFSIVARIDGASHFAGNVRGGAVLINGVFRSTIFSLR